MKLKLLFIATFLFIFIKNSHGQNNKDTVFTLYYNSNESQLTDNHLKILKDILPTIKSIKKIEGFADSVGSISSNYTLSYQRAFNVGIYFLAHKMSSISGNLFLGKQHKMDTIFYKNRRVDIYCTLKTNGLLIVEEKPIVTINEPSTTAAAKPDSIIELDLKNIQFIPDLPLVDASSISYLEPLAKQLKAYNAKHIDIIGHTNVGGKYYHNLSIKRAKTIYDFLVEKGISAATLNYTGVGNSRPIIEFPETVEEMKRNMRVEVIIKF